MVINGTGHHVGNSDPVTSNQPPFYVGADPTDLAAARDWLSDQLTDTWLMSGDIDELRLAITEAFTNLLQHAQPRTKSELSVNIEADRIHVFIGDDGPPFEPGVPTDIDREGGFGLMLLHMLVDEVDVTAGPTGGSVMRLTKVRPPD
ncbi:MAG: anti-sigma regulatory factor (Ser/Thr protein kinase) [Candidatus Poriferisodalaceae bacterium]|jgi:anti-sigma regulatory factor (Ser/Thr protein kinase)